MDSVVEWVDGIFRVHEDKGKGGEEHSMFIVMGDSIALIDVPNRSLGKKAISFVKNSGYDPSNIKYLILTNSHITQWAGLPVLSKIKPKIIIHESGKSALTEGQKYILKHQFPYTSKFGLAMKSSLFTKIKKVKEESITAISGSETIDLGGEELIIQPSGGHSSDSLLIHAYKAKGTFIGDEGNIYPDQPSSFFLDATGNSSKRLKLLQLLDSMKSNIIFPAHQSPELKPFDIYLQNLIFEHKHTKSTIYDLLISAGQAKTLYLAEEYTKILGIDWKTPYDELGVDVTTVDCFLKELEQENSAEFIPSKERWKAT